MHQSQAPAMTGSAPASAGSMHDVPAATPISEPASGAGASGSGGSQPTARSSENAVVIAEHTALLPDSANKPAGGGTVATAGRNIMELQAQVRRGLPCTSGRFVVQRSLEASRSGAALLWCGWD